MIQIIDYTEIKLEIYVENPLNLKNNTLLSNSWDKGEIKMKIKEYFELNTNENKTYKNLLDVSKQNLL